MRKVYPKFKSPYWDTPGQLDRRRAGANPKSRYDDAI